MCAAPTLTAGAVIVRRSSDGLRFLLLRAYRNWDFPKGVVRHGERPLRTATREVAEETGLTDLTFDWGHDFYETAVYSDNKVARYYLARTETRNVELRVNPELGRAEHHEFRWLDLTAAMDLVVPRIQSVIAWAAGKVMAEYDLPIARQKRRR